MYILIGFLLDCLIGDPHWIPHPVRWMGKGISQLEKQLYIDRDDARVQYRKGIILVIIMLICTAVLTYGLLFVTKKIHPMCYLAAASILSCYCLAAKDLKSASMAVYTAKDLDSKRKAVHMIVGRDTSVLNETGIYKATVETIAENTADGIIAPLFWMMIFGPTGSMVYKVINTMDSMIGYKNDHYFYFGKAAAKLDDAAGFLPARISGILMIVSAYICQEDGPNAKRIFFRDRCKHASPNSAQSESAMAGALDIQLGGKAKYFGQWIDKPNIGDDIRPIERKDIVRANRLMYCTTVLFVLITWIVRFVWIKG